MTLLLHLSDPHFGTEVPAVMASLVRLAHASQPALVIASGDITQRARRVQFAAARAFFDSLRAPLLVVPGNHDIPLFDLPARLLWPYRRWQHAFGNNLEPRAVLPNAWIAGLNTTRAWRHKHGQVDQAQAESAAAWLQGAARGVLRVVVTHQPLALTRAADQPDHLRGGREAARVWAAAGVHLVLGGHIHLPYFLSVGAVWPELPNKLWLAQAGTACSSRVRPEAGPSVNLIRMIAPAQWTLERWDYDAKERQFAPSSQTATVPLEAR